ncbi:MAG: hypothetical protein Q9202_005863 [Teloschistes flavicans]
MALTMTRDSDKENHQHLPSPYQLELLISPYTTAAYYACIGRSTSNNSVDIVISDPYGWLVVPKDVPSDIDFVATTIGSSTKCRAVTPLCDLNHVTVLTNFSGPEGNYSSYYPVLSYECKRDKAGLDLVGNMSATMNATTVSGFQLVEYTDPTMTTTSGDTDLRGPTLWYAAILQTNFPTTVGEILICSTELSDVKYSYEAGVYTGTSWTAMNSTSSFAFVSAMRETTATGLAVFQQAIQSIFATISNREHVASEWASVYDQTMLNVGDGLLVVRDPVSVIRSLVTQVTRIPRAPLLTLIILDLLYALIGTCLAIAAIIAVRKGRSVRDAQARLSTLAVIAESFESPAWGEDAQDVDMLFAERRGEPTRRIALVKQADGEGRKYKQLVVPKDHMKRVPTVEEFLARKTRLGPGGSQV